MKIALVRIIKGDEVDMPGQHEIIDTVDGPYTLMVVPIVEGKEEKALKLFPGAYTVVEVSEK